MFKLLPYKLRVLLTVVALICANIITLSLLKYDKYDCYLLEEDAVQDQITIKTTVTKKKRETNTLSTEFIRSNYFDTKMSYDYEIPQALVNAAEPPMTYEYDPRFTLGVYLNHIASHLNSGTIQPIPFSWYDFADLTALNKFIELPPSEKYTCKDLCTKQFTIYERDQMTIKFNENKEKRLTKRLSGGPIGGNSKERPKSSYNLPPCESYCRTDTTKNQPGFRISKNHAKARADVKTYQANSYLYSEAANPLDLVVVTENGNLQVPIKPNEGLNDKQQFNMMRSGLFKEYTAKNAHKINLLSTMNDLHSRKYIKKADNHIDFQSYRVGLEHERFVIDGPEYLSKLNASSDKTPKDVEFMKSMQRSLDLKESQLTKYFDEAKLGHEPDIKGYHYDWRFFKGKKFTLDEKHAILSRMLKTWFELTSSEGMISWVAHGGLLAHTFNGVNFPWDDDSDVQMPLADFVEFSRKYNQSMILENPKDGYGAYFIDVGDSITHRVKGKGANNIDARMIDIHSGVFVDITALAVTKTNLPERYEEDYKALEDHDIKYRDPNHPNDEDIVKSQAKTEIDSEQNGPDVPDLVEDLKANSKLPREFALAKILEISLSQDKAARYDTNYKLKVYNCRNNHFYQLKDLSPLRLSYFEKVPVLVPNDIPKILEEEYKAQGLLSAKFNSHTFIPQLRMWLPNALLTKNLRNGELAKARDRNLLEEADILNLLKEDYVLEYYNKIWDSSLLNEKERMIMRDDKLENKDELLGDLLINRKFKPIMRDPFMEQLEQESEVDGSIDREDLKSKAYERLSKQLKLEYAHKIDFGNIGTVPKTMKNNFNEISTDLKNMLAAYSSFKLGRDSDSKVSTFMDRIGKAAAEEADARTKINPITGLPFKQKQKDEVNADTDKSAAQEPNE